VVLYPPIGGEVWYKMNRTDKIDRQPKFKLQQHSNMTTQNPNTQKRNLKADADTTKPTTTTETSRYIVTTENVETGTKLFGTYTCESPTDAVQAVISGDHQSPPRDPSYDIASEDASSFTVFKIDGEPETITRKKVTRTKPQSNGAWTITESKGSTTIKYDEDLVITLPTDTVEPILSAIATAYPGPGQLETDAPIHHRAPIHESFINHEVGSIRIYPATPSENASMWVSFTMQFKIPSRSDAEDLLNLLHRFCTSQEECPEA